MEAKKTRGKQHIEIKKIQNEKDRQVAFSKRKNGIYKKASELVALCDIEVGILLLSPGGKPFTFANPSLESIAGRFINGNPSPESAASSLLEAHRKNKLVQLNDMYNSLSGEINAKKLGGSSEELEKEKNEDKEWWNTPEDESSHEELKQREISFFELRKTLYNVLKEKMSEASCSMRD